MVLLMGFDLALYFFIFSFVLDGFFRLHSQQPMHWRFRLPLTLNFPKASTGNGCPLDLQRLSVHLKVGVAISSF
jgi:hypothetical protein